MTVQVEHDNCASPLPRRWQGQGYRPGNSRYHHHVALVTKFCPLLLERHVTLVSCHALPCSVLPCASSLCAFLSGMWELLVARPLRGKGMIDGWHLASHLGPGKEELDTAHFKRPVSR